MAGEISTTQLATGALAASAAGRALMAAGFFTDTELSSQFASGARPTRCAGAAMTNRLNLATGVPAGETVTIGANVYEFRADTPPSGGTAGRIWVYNGGGAGVAATCRANLVNAINNVVDAANITYNGAVTEAFVASQAGGDVTIVSSAAVGSATIAASATATACADGLGAAADIWDAAACYGGKAENTRATGIAGVALVAAMITNGSVAFPFPFTPTRCILVNRARPQNEAITIAGNSVSLALAGGVSPNNQAGDVIDVLAWA